MKKERPILFSTPMIQALLAGRKTQTRRIVKPQPFIDTQGAPHYVWNPKKLNGHGFYFSGSLKGLVDTLTDPGLAVCPYGQVGEYIWVREEHYRFGHWEKNGFTERGAQKWKFIANSKTVLYNDNAPATRWGSRQAHNKAGNHESMPSWYKRLARFMPKSACRIWLEITDIHVERVREIAEEDACWEGIGSDDHGELWEDYAMGNDPERFRFIEPSESFKTLWQKINGPESWETNQFVWVVSFKVLSTTGKLENI